MAPKYGTFKEYLKERYAGPFVATDIIIRYNDGNTDGIVLIERKYPPFGIALPGGIAEYLTLETNAIKEAKEETGLDVILDSPNRPLCVFSEPTQDPRAFIASVAYTAQGGGILKPQEEEDAKSARVYTLGEIADLLDKPVWAFPDHHRKILKIYLGTVGGNENEIR
ncbi:MAG: NUDIX hydrolase [Nanoarchaeota archaeon]